MVGDAINNSLTAIVQCPDCTGTGMIPYRTSIIQIEPATTIQKPPEENDGTVVLDRVLKDFQDRAEVGKARYGTYLKTNNGREALVDAYQEAMDLVMYLKQELMERETVQDEINSRPDPGASLEDRIRYILTSNDDYDIAIKELRDLFKEFSQ
jgi:hypothetical protein